MKFHPFLRGLKPSLSQGGILENQFQRKLNDPGIVRARDLSKTSAAQGCINSIKVCGIPEIKGLRPELNVGPLAQSEILEEAHIPVIHAWTPDCSGACIAESPEGWRCVSRRVEPLRHGMGACGALTGNEIWPRGEPLSG